MTSYSWTTSVFIKLLESKKPSKRAVQFSFTSRHTVPVPTSIPSSNYSPHSRRSSAELPHILSRMRHSPSGASARPSPRVSLKSLELNALHTSQTQDMVHLNGNRSNGTSGTPFSHLRFLRCRRFAGAELHSLDQPAARGSGWRRCGI